MRRKAQTTTQSARNPESHATPHSSLTRHGKPILAALDKLGIQREFDLVLHLPMRYDDETRLLTIESAPRGVAVLVEGVVIDSAVKYRPKRQLVCTIEDDSGVLVMRFLNFYMSQIKQLASGTRVRLYGEIRDGFLGGDTSDGRTRQRQLTLEKCRQRTAVLAEQRTDIDHMISELDDFCITLEVLIRDAVTVTENA